MSYLIKHAQAIFFDQAGSDPSACDIRISAGLITEVGSNLRPLAQANETIIDASACVIYPGFVNTHHHLAQSVLKGVPEGINLDLGQWLAEVPYRFWPKIPPRLMYLSAMLGFYELIRSGATTCADHHYLYHANVSDEVELALWQAAKDSGIRFTLCRGSATAVGSHKGMQKAKLRAESIDQVLTRMQSSVALHHDPSAYAMQRVCVAPTSLIHSATAQDLKLLASFARSHQLKMHSHLLEVSYDEQQAQQQHMLSAIDYADSCDWLGEDVYFAHLVKADAKAIALLASSNTGMSHCPTSNCRLGSGIAPALAMSKAGALVSLGVDGSASSESGSMLQELNLAWLLQRSVHGAAALKPESVLKWASINGAQTLGLKTGSIKVGYAADLVLYDVEQARVASVHHKLFAPLLCGEPMTIKHSFINGEHIINDTTFTRVDVRGLMAELNQAMAQFLKTVGDNN